MSHKKPTYKDQPQCTATSKQSGERCKQAAKLGGKVCHYHGGNAPQTVKANARRILEGLVGPALVTLQELMLDSEVPASVRYQALRDVLDRTGLKPVDKAEVLLLTDEAIAAEIARLKADQ